MAGKKSQPTYGRRSNREDHDCQCGTLYIVGTPIGCHDDLTIRGLSILKLVSIVASETPRVTQALLEHHGVHATITSYNSSNCMEKIPLLLHRLGLGQDVALVSDCGMPVIYDPGRHLIAAARRADYAVVVVPGPSALTAAVAVSGLSGDRVLFEGRLPQNRGLLGRFFARLRREPRTMVFFLSCRSVSAVLKSLAHAFPTRHLALAINLTRDREQLYQGRADLLLKNLRSIPSRGEITVVLEGFAQRRTTSRRRKWPKKQASRRHDVE